MRQLHHLVKVVVTHLPVKALPPPPMVELELFHIVSVSLLNQRRLLMGEHDFQILLLFVERLTRGCASHRTGLGRDQNHLPAAAAGTHDSEDQRRLGKAIQKAQALASAGTQRGHISN